MNAVDTILEVHSDLVTSYSLAGESLERSLDNAFMVNAIELGDDKLLGRTSPRDWIDYLYRTSQQGSLFLGLEWATDGTLAIALLMAAVKERRERNRRRKVHSKSLGDPLVEKLTKMIESFGEVSSACDLASSYTPRQLLNEARDRIFFRLQAVRNFEDRVGAQE